MCCVSAVAACSAGEYISVEFHPSNAPTRACWRLVRLAASREEKLWISISVSNLEDLRLRTFRIFVQLSFSQFSSRRSSGCTKPRQTRDFGFATFFPPSPHKLRTLCRVGWSPSPGHLAASELAAFSMGIHVGKGDRCTDVSESSCSSMHSALLSWQV